MKYIEPQMLAALRQANMMKTVPNPAHGFDCSDPTCTGCWKPPLLVFTFPDGIKVSMRNGHVVGIDHAQDMNYQPLPTATGVMAMIEERKRASGRLLNAAWDYLAQLVPAEPCENNSCRRCRLAALLYEITQHEMQDQQPIGYPAFEETRALVQKHAYQPLMQTSDLEAARAFRQRRREQEFEESKERQPTRDGGSIDEEHF
jgi:hypothetical protein